MVHDARQAWVRRQPSAAGDRATLRLCGEERPSMGQDIERKEFTREDRTRYREKVRTCLDVFARMLRESRFDFERPMTGIEVELNLVDDGCDPAMKNAEALEAIADPDFVTELGQFNLEINVAP